MSTPTPAGFTLAIQTFTPPNGSSPACCTFTIAAIAGNPSWVVLSGQSGGPIYPGSGSNIQVTPPPNTELQMTFTLEDAAYALVGLYFTAQIVGGADPSIMGMTDFPTISCTPTNSGGTYTGSQVVMTDVSGLSQTYVYKIVVQQLSTGLLGLLDPTVEPDM